MALFGRRRGALGATVLDTKEVFPKGPSCVPFKVVVRQHGPSARKADISAEALTSDGYPIGQVWASTNASGRTLDVFDARVESPGCGVGTRLYEALAREACARDYTLRSDLDTNLSKFSRGFWDKQVAKKRARFDKRSDRFALKKCELTLERSVLGGRARRRSR